MCVRKGVEYRAYIVVLRARNVAREVRVRVRRAGVRKSLRWVGREERVSWAEVVDAGSFLRDGGSGAVAFVVEEVIEASRYQIIDVA